MKELKKVLEEGNVGHIWSKLSDFFLSNDFNDRKKLAVITLANRKFAKQKNCLKFD